MMILTRLMNKAFSSLASVIRPEPGVDLSSLSFMIWDVCFEVHVCSERSYEGSHLQSVPSEGMESS